MYTPPSAIAESHTRDKENKVTLYSERFERTVACRFTIVRNCKTGER